VKNPVQTWKKNPDGYFKLENWKNQVQIDRGFTCTEVQPCIRPSLTQSKWNMDEMCGLKFHLSYVDMPQDFFRKFLIAHTMSFLLLNM
jgi:hypothetical protein